jgi:hypothetical protein
METRGEKAVRLLRAAADAMEGLPIPASIFGTGWDSDLLRTRADWIETQMAIQSKFQEVVE